MISYQSLLLRYFIHVYNRNAFSYVDGVSNGPTLLNFEDKIDSMCTCIAIYVYRK